MEVYLTYRFLETGSELPEAVLHETSSEKEPAVEDFKVPQRTNQIILLWIESFVVKVNSELRS